MRSPALFRTIELSQPEHEHDGLRTITVRSPALGGRGDVSIWVPGASKASRIDTLVLLLHGVYGSHWVWSQKAGAPSTAQRLLAAGEIRPMVLAMPSDGLLLDGSAYLTHPGGMDAERWIVDEVPQIAHLAAPALTANARIVIAGLSMGGYGALRLGAKYPERFCGISAHSAITEIDEIGAFTEEPLSRYLACGTRDDLSPLHWLRRHHRHLPPLRFDCGLDDSLLPGNRRLHAALDTESIPHHYTEFPGGHTWPYWQEHLAETLRFASGC